MRHFSLIKLLTFSSVASSNDGLQWGGRITKSSVRSQHLQQSLMSTESNVVTSTTTSRRRALQSILGGSLTFVASGISAGALDMDAFVNSQLDSDTKYCDPSKSSKCIPKLSGAEALCKYGQSGKARSEACSQVKESGGALPKPGSEGKSLGGAYAM